MHLLANTYMGEQIHTLASEYLHGGMNTYISERIHILGTKYINGLANT